MFSQLSLITGAYASDATAAAGGGAGGNAILTLLIYLVPIILVFYFLAIRPQKKRDKQMKEMRDSLNIGDEIVTIGGIIGKIVKIKEDRVTIATADSKMVFLKSAIGSISKSVSSGLDDDEVPAEGPKKKKKHKTEELAAPEGEAAAEDKPEAAADAAQEPAPSDKQE